MNILLTGGAGYIGSHVALNLLDAGYEVTIIDDLSTGKKKLIPSKAEFIHCNLNELEKIESLLKTKKFLALMHFAGFVEVEESVSCPEKYFENNTANSIKLFDLCLQNNLSNIIFSSTAAVYASNDKTSIKENSKKKPITPYAISKYECEKYFKKDSKIKYVILRYFNVAGVDFKFRSGIISKKKSTHLITKICESYLSNKTIEIYGFDYPSHDGTAIRDFIHVVDLAQAHIQAAKYLMSNNKSLVLNCGYGYGYTVKEVIDNFNKMNKKKINYSFSKRRKGDVFRLIANSSLIKKKLNWKPKYDSIKKILKSSLDWESKINKRI